MEKFFLSVLRNAGKNIKILDRLSPFIKIYEAIIYLKRQNVGCFRRVETKKKTNPNSISWHNAEKYFAK